MISSNGAVVCLPRPLPLLARHGYIKSPRGTGETPSCFPVRGLSLMSDDPQELAVEYLRQAYESQMKGEYAQALDLYTRSIDAFPTAEAYTFRGWTYSFMGKLDEAIRECLEAIRVDPEFGNPYNDIGAYLIEQGKWDEAIE